MSATPRERAQKGYSEGRWAPVVVEVLLHVFVYPKPLHESVSTWAALATLQNAQMIRPQTDAEREVDSSSEHHWVVLPRGRAHIAQLLALPYPRQSTGWETADGKPIEVK